MSYEQEHRVSEVATVATRPDPLSLWETMAVSPTPFVRERAVDLIEFMLASQQQGMPDSFISGLASFSGAGDCAICSVPYADEALEVAVLPCHEQHNFHQKCISEWLRSHSTCPLCRTDFRASQRVPEIKVVDDVDDVDDMNDLYG